MSAAARESRSRALESQTRENRHLPDLVRRHHWLNPITLLRKRHGSAPSSGAFEERMIGFEPTIFCMARYRR